MAVFLPLFKCRTGRRFRGSLGSCAPGYGSVRLVSVGHYPVVGMRLAIGIPAANYVGITENEKITRLARVRKLVCVEQLTL